MAFMAFVAGMVFMAALQLGSIVWLSASRARVRVRRGARGGGGGDTDGHLRAVKRFFSPQRHRPLDKQLMLHKRAYNALSEDEVKAVLGQRNLNDAVSCEWFNAVLCKVYASLHSDVYRDTVSEFIKVRPCEPRSLRSQGRADKRSASPAQSEFEEVQEYLHGRFVKNARLRDYSLSRHAAGRGSAGTLGARCGR